MTLKKMLVLLGAILVVGAILVACGPTVPAATEAPVAAEAPAATEAPAAATEVPAAAPADVAVSNTDIQFETCNGCHADSGSMHQKYYGQLNQDGAIKVEGLTYKFTPAAGDQTDTTVVTIKMTKDGKPFDGSKVENLNIYYTPFSGTEFTKNPAMEAAEGRTSLKGKLSYDAASGVTTSTLVELAATDKAYVDYSDVSKVTGILVVYGYDKQVGSLPERIKQVQFPYAGLLKFGTVDYASAANNDGCEKCHSDPYLKHGNIYGQVAGDPATDFITCKVCHFDDGEGGHLNWQMNVENPEEAAAYMEGGEEATPEQAEKYAYRTTLMNDVHMSHAMEFPYPQSMSNCVTCHEGKLDKVLSDANFNVETCKSCHAVTGSVGPTPEGAEEPIYDTTKLALKTILPEIHASMDLNTTDCTTCHGTGEGKTAKPFNQIHTGYEKSIYTADGKRISDIVTVSIDKAAYAEGKLTFSFSVASSEEIGLDVNTITPTVLVGLYGWDSKDFVVGAHERLFDDNNDGTIDSKDGRALELTLDGKAENPRIQVVTAADGKWEVTADLSAWKDLIGSGTVKRVEIGIMPALTNADEVAVAVNATSKTFDLTTNKFAKFYPQVVKVDGCNECHDALATTFHSPSYGGSVVVCSMCHIVKSGGSHLEMQSRTIDSYIHAIHNSQQFDVADIDFANPVQAEKYALDSELPFPKHGITNCEACHNPGTYDVPSQSNTLPGILSASEDTLNGKTRSISGVPSYVTGPTSMACGSCHRATLINEDNAQGLALFNQHIAKYGYMVEAGENPIDTLNSVWDQIMPLFK